VLAGVFLKGHEEVHDSRKLVAEACQGIRPRHTPIFDLFRNTAVIEHFAGHPLDGSADWDTVMRATGNALDCFRSLDVPHTDGETWTDEMGDVHLARRWTSWVQRRALTAEDEWKAWIEARCEQLEAESLPSPAERVRVAAEQSSFNAKVNGAVCIHCTPSTALNSALFGHCGLEMFSYLWADYPKLVLRWFRALEHHTGMYIERTADPENGELAMIYSDMAYKQRLMLGKPALNQLGVFDDVAAICARCHAKGMRVIFHSDGNIMDIVDDLVAAGIDGLNPLEKAAGMDIFELRRRYPELILVGGVDVTHLLPFGTPDEVRRETRHIIQEVGAAGRLLIGSSTELGDDVPLANYLALHDEAMAE
jgi:hypothetical protein